MHVLEYTLELLLEVILSLSKTTLEISEELRNGYCIDRSVPIPQTPNLFYHFTVITQTQAAANINSWSGLDTCLKKFKKLILSSSSWCSWAMCGQADTA